MTKKRVFVKHKFYDVQATVEQEKSVKKTYGDLSENKKHPTDFADRWLDKVNVFIANLKTPKNLGIIDPESFSDTYSYIQIPNTKTTIFLLVEENKIYLATSGYSGRNWKKALQDKEPEINKQIQILKAKTTQEKKNILEKNIKSNHSLPLSNTKKQMGETMEDAEHKRRQEEAEERLKWAKAIAENPDMFNAALKGISEAKLRAELDEQIEQDFAPEELTQEDHERLNKIQEDYLPEIEPQELENEVIEPPDELESIAEENTLSPEQQEELNWLNSSEENQEPESQSEESEKEIDKEVQERLKEQEEQRNKEDYTK